MADIFLSYAQADKVRVAPIVDALKSFGWSVWWDAEGAAGARLDEMVDREIAVAGCMVVVWSRASVASDWVLGEADEARERRELVPVSIDDVRPPRRFRQFNAVDLSDWEGDRESPGFRKLVAGLRIHLSDRSGAGTEDESPVLTPPGDTRGDDESDRSPPQSHLPRPRRRLGLYAGLLVLGVGAALFAVLDYDPQPPKSIEKVVRPFPVEPRQVPPHATATVSGRILFDGLPVSRFSNAPAKVTLMDSSTRKAVRTELSYDPATSAYTLRNVPVGKFTVFARIESGHPYDQESGGDFYSRLSGFNDPIEIPPNTTRVTRDLKVLAVVHLRSPDDNQQRTRTTRDPPIVFHIPGKVVQFRWDKVPRAGRYELTFITKDANGQRVDYKRETVTGTTFSHSVPNRPDYQHAFSISAFSAAGARVGEYQYYYKNGSGGWLDYKVR